VLQTIGLSTHVWNNFFRSALLLAGFPVLLTLLSFGLSMVFAYSAGSVGEGFVVAWHHLPAYLGGACLASLVWFAIAWMANQRIIDAVSGARPASRETDLRLWDLMETLCISRGETMPRLAVIENAGRNAFASGLDRRRGNITVTSGLVEALDDRELSAVLAHELTHIRNGDARLAVIAAVFTGVITLGFDLLRNMRWFEVVETRGHIEDGKVAHWQVTVQVGFKLEDAAQD
jgi:heat shock protein HtpX